MADVMIVRFDLLGQSSHRYFRKNATIYDLYLLSTDSRRNKGEGRVTKIKREEGMCRYMYGVIKGTVLNCLLKHFCTISSFQCYFSRYKFPQLILIRKIYEYDYFCLLKKHGNNKEKKDSLNEFSNNSRNIRHILTLTAFFFVFAHKSLW